MGELLLLIYMIAGYWATEKTIYRNKIIVGTLGNIFMTRLIWGTLFGIVLIPWAVVCLLIKR